MEYFAFYPSILFINLPFVPICLFFQFDFREARRIVYVPFIGDSIRGVTPAEINCHISFKKELNSGDLSAAMIISLREHFSTHDMASITDEHVPFVAQHLEGAIPDVILSYAIALWFTTCSKVSYI